MRRMLFGQGISTSDLIVTRSALQSFDALFHDDGNYDQGRHRVGPPQAEEIAE